jgi:hypothetical protein
LLDERTYRVYVEFATRKATYVVLTYRIEADDRQRHALFLELESNLPPLPFEHPLPESCSAPVNVLRQTLLRYKCGTLLVPRGEFERFWIGDVLVRAFPEADDARGAFPLDLAAKQASPDDE